MTGEPGLFSSHSLSQIERFSQAPLLFWEENRSGNSTAPDATQQYVWPSLMPQGFATQRPCRLQPDQQGTAGTIFASVWTRSAIVRSIQEWVEDD